MKARKRQKLCYNCEGDIDLDVIVCPYCAADLREEKPELKEMPPKSSRMQQMSHSLYPPAYPIRQEEEETIPSSPAAVSPPPVATLQEDTAQEPSERAAAVVGPILLFTVGVTLFLLGILLILFSHHGEVVLKWDARLWFLYLFASVPFLVFGYRAISKL